MNRAVLGFSVGLCLVGGVALGGLAAPLASGYLLAGQTAGGTTITPTTSPLVRIRYSSEDAHLHLMQAGRAVELWVEHDADARAPDCRPEPGRA